eukprot:SAG22_NODE_86_length_21440_cov_288.248700_15_plen_69_part_00
MTAPQDYKDTSAATITASALLELSVFTAKPQFRDAAVQILHSISCKCTSALDGGQRSAPPRACGMITS